MAVCLMNSGQPQKAINIFYEIIEDNPNYRKNVYLLSAIAYKRLNQLESSLAIVRYNHNLAKQRIEVIS